MKSIDKKICFIYAGVNGAGKTTLYRMNQDKELGKRVNIDEILSESKGDWKSEEDQRKATILALRLLDEYLKNNETFNYETVFTGNVLPFLEKIKKSGYLIYVHYIGLDNYNIAIDRVKNRVSKGGHGISEENIIRRYNDSLNNLKQAIEICDRVYLYDNSRNMIKVASFVNGKLNCVLNKCEWFEKFVGEIL